MLGEVHLGLALLTGEAVERGKQRWLC